MPTPRERKKARLSRAKRRQHKAIYLQRTRVKRLAGLRAAVRKARSNIGRRRGLIRRLEAELASGPVTIVGNKASGGTALQRLEAVAKAAALEHLKGRRKSFYSQAGAWTVQYAITGEPRGYRSDCSQWFTSAHWSAGGWRGAGHPEFLPDPNGTGYTGGYTGTLGSHGRQINSAARKTGDAGLYGTPPFHHVEMCVGAAFIGHGSPPIDAITPGFPNVFRTYLD